MYYTYILYSDSADKYYYGSTFDIEKRITEHNKGKVKFTKPLRPWKLIYHEEFNSRSEAYKRELYFKSIDGRNWLKMKQII